MNLEFAEASAERQVSIDRIDVPEQKNAVGEPGIVKYSLDFRNGFHIFGKSHHLGANLQRVKRELTVNHDETHQYSGQALRKAGLNPKWDKIMRRGRQSPGIRLYEFHASGMKPAQTVLTGKPG